jgi:hypothetical protein
MTYFDCGNLFLDFGEVILHEEVVVYCVANIAGEKREKF